MLEESKLESPKIPTPMALKQPGDISLLRELI
jgi:hypothetical protein